MRLNNIWSPHESVPYSIWQDLKFSVSSTMNKNVNVYMVCVFARVCIVQACMVTYCRSMCVCVWCVHLSAYVHTVYIVGTLEFHVRPFSG